MAYINSLKFLVFMSMFDSLRVIHDKGSMDYIDSLNFLRFMSIFLSLRVIHVKLLFKIRNFSFYSLNLIF